MTNVCGTKVAEGRSRGHAAPTRRSPGPALQAPAAGPAPARAGGVAASGYHGTSVKQVIALAGVSRRSFYEQFANKEECLLATFDLLAGNAVSQAGEAYRRTTGPLQER